MCGLNDPALFPLRKWRECVSDSVNAVELGNWATDYSAIDDEVLVEQMTQRVLVKRGIVASPEEVLVTLGGQQALYLAIKLLLSAGETLGVEDPGYPDVVNMARFEGGQGAAANDNWRQNASALLSRWCDPVMGGSPPGSVGVPPAQILPQLQPSPPPESTGSGALPLLRPGPCGSRRQGGRLQHRRETERQPKGQHAGGTPALPGGAFQGEGLEERYQRDARAPGGCRPDGEVGGIRRATSLKAGLSPLGNSRLPASRAPAPRDWADPSRRTINGTSMHRMHRIIRTGGCCRRG